MDNILKFLTPKTETYYLDSHSSVRQALEKFDYYKFSCVPLIDKEGKYITTVSQGDILSFIKNDNNFNIRSAENTNIDDIPKYRPYVALSIDASMEQVLELSLEQNFIPIVDDRGIYLGILKRKTILLHFSKQYNKN